MATRNPRARAEKDAPGTLTVACKLPNGLHIQVPGTKIDIKLHGAHSAFAVGGHGMTRGVNPQEWARVEEFFAGAKWLKNELVFAMKSPKSAADKAEDMAENVTGFEPVDPDEPNKIIGARGIQPDGAPDGR